MPCLKDVALAVLSAWDPFVRSCPGLIVFTLSHLLRDNFTTRLPQTFHLKMKPLARHISCPLFFYFILWFIVTRHLPTRTHFLHLFICCLPPLPVSSVSTESYTLNTSYSAQPLPDPQ